MMMTPNKNRKSSSHAEKNSQCCWLASRKKTTNSFYCGHKMWSKNGQSRWYWKSSTMLQRGECVARERCLVVSKDSVVITIKTGRLSSWSTDDATFCSLLSSTSWLFVFCQPVAKSMSAPTTLLKEKAFEEMDVIVVMVNGSNMKILLIFILV